MGAGPGGRRPGLPAPGLSADDLGKHERKKPRLLRDALVLAAVTHEFCVTGR
ncbi:hypothetical protein GCM10018773_27570 [Streptomyces candidus]|nr:hypothetical protein GCM10018773_27570 [Streptomyces candidus]